MGYSNIHKEYIMQIEEMQKEISWLHEKISTLKDIEDLSEFNSEQFDEMIVSMSKALKELKTANEKGQEFRDLYAARWKTVELIELLRRIDRGRAFKEDISRLLDLQIILDGRLA